jgi:putative flippase GtrA
MKNTITSFIDFFYPPFRRFMPLQTFRYIACGGTNTVLDILVYFISYNFILKKQNIDFGFVTISSYISAFLIAFAVSFPTGFYLNRNVVFTGSTLKGRVQLFRYFLLVAVCIALNYIFIKLFVEQFNIYPTVAKVLTTIVVISFSYLTQRHFTFKVEEKKAD